MNKIFIPVLMVITLALSGCIVDPFYGDHGGGRHHGGGWGHHDRGDYRGR